MAKPLDCDVELESLQSELRSIMAVLNDLHHPVNPGDPDKIKALEAEVASLKAAINERRGALKKQAARPIRMNRRSANA